MAVVNEPSPPTQAQEKALTVRGATVLGIGSMIGAGIFALLGEAGAVAGICALLGGQPAAPEPYQPADLPGLAAYRATWRAGMPV